MSKEFEWTAELLAEFIRDYGDREGRAADLMEQFKESKQPNPKILFVSKDGIPIHKGERFYYVDKLYRICDYWADECWTYGIDGVEFSTKEEAEEYILMNKPLLSANDIISHVVNHSVYKDNYKDLIISLAKEKLNKP